MLRMRSGEIREVFYVAKGLLLRERTKGLSTGERKMLALAKNILISELVLATGRDKEEIEAEIEEKAENK